MGIMVGRCEVKLALQNTKKNPISSDILTLKIRFTKSFLSLKGFSVMLWSIHRLNHLII